MIIYINGNLQTIAGKLCDIFMLNIRTKNKSIYFAQNKASALYQTFQTVNSWVQFAEAKHGALLTVNVAVLMGWVAILYSNYGKMQSQNFKYLILAIVALIVIAMGISVWSFLPDLGKVEKAVEKNLLFFGDIADKKKFSSSKDYLEQFTNNQSFDEMLADEIVHNSIIAKRKFKQFTWSLVLSLCAYILTAYLLIAFQGF